MNSNVGGTLTASGFSELLSESLSLTGKTLRTVNSCIETNWCRVQVGVQPGASVLACKASAVFNTDFFSAMAIASKSDTRVLMLLVRKSNVSGCVHGCAETWSKDCSLIATNKGRTVSG